MLAQASASWRSGGFGAPAHGPSCSRPRTASANQPFGQRGPSRGLFDSCFAPARLEHEQHVERPSHHVGRALVVERDQGWRWFSLRKGGERDQPRHRAGRERASRWRAVPAQRASATSARKIHSKMRPASGEQVVVSAAGGAATTAAEVSPLQRRGSAREALQAAESGLSPRELRKQRTSAAVAEVPAVPAAEDGATAAETAAETATEEAATGKPRRSPQPFRMSAGRMSFMPKVSGFWSRRGWQSGVRPPPAAKKGSKPSCPPVSEKESQRRAIFCKAVRAYEWETAQALAATEQERVDVANSQVRVDWMEYFLAQGDSTQAMLYAITREERQRAEAVGDAATAAPQSDETETAISQLTNVFSELPSPSRRTSMTSRITSAIGSPFRRKSSKDGEASPKANGGEVHLQAGRV